MDWQKFRSKKIKPVQLIEQPAPEPIPVPKCEKGENSEALKKPFFSHIEPLPKVEIFKKEQPQSWEPEITELETYFAAIELPQQPVKPNRYSTITSVSLFIETHFATVKANNGKRTFLPFLNRLQELKNYLTLNRF
jgi:chromatin segregation and condensation protein Rec8/ScpA/Scc1 (kleisin family)